MKKQIFLVTLLMVIIPNCYSQGYNKDVRFGIRAGVNFSHLNFSIASVPSDDPLEMSWNVGFVGGVYMIVPLRENLYLQPEYLFSQTGGEAESSNLNYKLNYLSLPVFLRYEATRQFAFIAGPQFDLLINAKEENRNDSKITRQTEARSVGLAGGIEFGFTNSLSLGIRYFQSVHDIWIPVTTNNKEEFKHQLIQASMSYIF
jgi:hypothetical protein